ncbi:MAG TPA: transcriptional repressor, partial [Burkholderiaceae bacterium]|nr:transcriptional repressor [Burkholderiaceae bacterium]
MQRQTRQRDAVLQAIEGAGRALTPAEILALAQGAVARLNLSTIYRQLHALQDEARIARVLLPGQPPRFEAVCAGTRDAPQHHHHHFH